MSGEVKNDHVDVPTSHAEVSTFKPENYSLTINCLRRIRFDKSDMTMIGKNLLLVIIVNAVLWLVSYGLVVYMNNDKVILP